MCYVSTAKQNGDSVQPKSWLIIPGHLDPQFGTHENDAPTTSWVAVQMAVTIAVTLNVWVRLLISVLPSCQGYRQIRQFTSAPRHVAYRQWESVQQYEMASFSKC